MMSPSNVTGMNPPLGSPLAPQQVSSSRVAGAAESTSDEEVSAHRKAHDDDSTSDDAPNDSNHNHNHKHKQSNTMLGSDGVSSSGGSRNDTDSMASGFQQQTQDDGIATNETNALKGCKCIVVGILVVLTTVLAVLVYFYTSSQERNNFEEQFDEYGGKILEDVGDILEQTFGAVDLLSIDVVASAHSSSQEWPNVVVSDFGVRAAKTIGASRIKVLVMCVLITSQTRAKWENFTAISGRQWVDNTVSIMATDTNYYGPLNTEYFTNNEIHKGGGVPRPEDLLLMLPSWHAYPIVPFYPPYNFDYFTLDYTKAHYSMVNSGKVTITEPYMVPDVNNATDLKDAQDLASWYKDRIPPDEEPLEPAAEIYFPIFNSFDKIQADPENDELVATFASSFYWRDMMRDILPKGSPGIAVVIDNDCAPTFTYEIIGPDVKYLGRGDHHSREFDDLELSAQISSLDSFRIRNSTYTGPPLDEDFCPYTFRIYPTNELQDQHITSLPIVFTVMAVAIFLITSMTFMLYDFFVAKRQNAILTSAEKSNAVVSSLFPANVRDRLYAESGKKRSRPRNFSNLVQDVAYGTKRRDSIQAQGRRSTTNDRSSSLISSAAREADNTNGSNAMDDINHGYEGRPIAELYTSTTVMIADIVGFTAWSSTREPEQVFTLLEAIYGAFDKIARQRGVFKVETIGDSYVAVCGLPTERKFHAVVMVRFAHDCRSKMSQLTKVLSTTLGPGTNDLCMRFGLNSGPTTAGVLRGDKSRFQLFGDTINTAARMESTGKPNRIHVTQKTADLIVDGGKGSWVTPREEIVTAKGKGDIQTYWVDPRGAGSVISSAASLGAASDGLQGGDDVASSTGGRASDDISVGSSKHSGKDGSNANVEGSLLGANQNQPSQRRAKAQGTPGSAQQAREQSRIKRLVDWNADLLLLLLKDLVVDNAQGGSRSIDHMSGSGHGRRSKTWSPASAMTPALTPTPTPPPLSTITAMPRNEIVDKIAVPKAPRASFSSSKKAPSASAQAGSISAKAQQQLRQFVGQLASLHQSNPFHNFEHATHVAMSTRKLLSRVLSPLSPDDSTGRSSIQSRSSHDAVSMSINRCTYAVTSDPLIQFALVFSALIHDVDHPGVPNGVLVKEKAKLASLYDNKSVAEQNSISVAWDLLMSHDYEDLRRCMFKSDLQIQRFRQLVVNAVMATDVFDPELKSFRDSRWEKAFSTSLLSPIGGAALTEEAQREVHEEAANLRATIVIEHLIQASDVAHTMQHWTVYQKWNHRLFREMRAAFRAGRTSVDPAEKWYEGELWFFDNNIIPLAQKLKECGVFGVSCDEALDYAFDNRLEWKQKGRSIVERWIREDEESPGGVGANMITSSSTVDTNDKNDDSNGDSKADGVLT